MSTVTVAATQMACRWDRDANMARAEKLVREAAAKGANVILLQELFETPYFCKDHIARHLELALPLDGHPAVEHFRNVARELGVVLPISVLSAPTMRFTTPSPSSMRTVPSSAAIANRIFRKGPGITKNSISRPAIPASRYSPRGTPSWVLRSVGINGFPRRHARWR